MKFSITQALKSAFVILLLSGSTNSCNIREDMRDCFGYIVLDYSLYADWSLDDIEAGTEVELFLFNTDSICYDILRYSFEKLEKESFVIPIPISCADRYALVWHGHKSKQYNREKMILGNRMSDFILELKTENNFYSQIMDPLWASSPKEAMFCTENSTFTMPMVRIPNLLNISLSSISGTKKQLLDMNKYDVTVVAANNIYNIDYNVHPNSTKINYSIAEIATTENKGNYAKVGLKRLEVTADCKMYITNIETGERISIAGNDHIDLIKYLLEGVSANDDKQQFLDVNHVWDIHFAIDNNNTAISLTVNDWTVWFNNTDL